MSEIEAYLAHYGVKGMKWGKSKGGSSAKTRHPDYGANQQRYDAGMYGKGHAKRVNKGMHQGKTLKESRDASHKVQNRRTLTGMALGVAAYGAMAAGPTLKIGIDQAVVSKQKSNGKKHTDNMFADKNGLGSKPTVNLGYNSNTDTWE